MKQSKITRRSFLLGLGAASAATVLTACGGSGSSASGSAAASGRSETGLTAGNFPAARALSEAMETAEEPGTPPETGTTLPPTA